MSPDVFLRSLQGGDEREDREDRTRERLDDALLDDAEPDEQATGGREDVTDDSEKLWIHEIFF